MSEYKLNPVVIKETAGVRPTVYVALGGSGAKTLMYLRRQIYTRYRRPELPIQRFVFCDTDQAANNLGDRTSVDVIEERIRPDQRWMVNMSAKSDEVRDVFQNKGNFPHIHKWFPEELTSNYDILLNGAGQIRPNGKLAFWLRYPEFMERIRDAVQEVKSNRSQQEMTKLFPKFRFDEKEIEVVIVAGLAGGTGSGCFLDAAMAVRSDPALENYHMTGILYTADVFKGIRNMDLTFMERNTFGALTELDAMMSGTMPERYLDTAFAWKGRNDRVNSAVRPFSAVYLIGAANRDGVEYETTNEVYEAVGEKLALEFDASDFGDKLRSIRSNALQHTQERRIPWRNWEDAEQSRLLYTDSFGSNYSSFGIAGILYDRFRLRNVASSLIARKLFDYLLGRGMERDTAAVEATRAIENLALTGDGLWASVLSREGTPMDRERTVALRSAIDEVRTRLGSQIDPANDPGGRAASAFLNRELQRLFNEHVEALNAANGPLRRGGAMGAGRDLEEIGANSGKLRRHAESRVREGFLQLLQRPEDAGIPAAESYLERLQAIFEELDGEVKRLQVAEHGTCPKVPNTVDEDGALKAARLRFEDATRIPKVFVPFRQTAEKICGDALRNAERGVKDRLERTLAAEFERAAERLLELLSERYQMAASASLIEVLKSLRATVGTSSRKIAADGGEQVVQTGLLQQLGLYREALQQRSQYSKDLQEAFAEKRKEYRNSTLSDSIDYEEVAVEYLAQRNTVDGVGSQLERAVVSNVFKTFLQSQAAGRDVDEDVLTGEVRAFVEAACGFREDSRRWEVTCENLEQMVHEQFGTFLQDRPIDTVLARNAQQRSEALNSRVDRKALAFVEVQEGIKQFNIEGSDTHLYGLEDGASSTAEEFLRKSPLAKRWKPVDLRSGSLIFYNEVNGLPLLAFKTLWRSDSKFLSSLMSDPGEAYKRFSHRDWWMFRPIMPPKTDQEARDNMEVSKVFWLGVITGVVTFAKGSNERYSITYQPDSGEGWREAVPLGSAIDHAIVVLRNNTNTAAELRRAVEARRDAMREAQLKSMVAAIYLNGHETFLSDIVKNEYGEAKRGGTGFRNLVMERLLMEQSELLHQQGVDVDPRKLSHQLKGQLQRSDYRDYDTQGDIYFVA